MNFNSKYISSEIQMHAFHTTTAKYLPEKYFFRCCDESIPHMVLVLDDKSNESKTKLYRRKA